VVLFTDGNETAGQAKAVIRKAQEQGVRIFAVPLSARGEGDAWLEAIEVPDVVRADEPVAARIRMHSRKEKDATVELLADGRLVERRNVHLQPGGSELQFDLRLPSRGLATLTAVLEAEGDEFPANDRQGRAVWVARAPQVLYVEGHPPSARYLNEALTAAGFAIVNRGARALPGAPQGLDPYDLVILSDVAAKDLSETQMRALRTYVRDGAGGLLFAGGENTYGEEGYSDSPIEEILPVRFRLKEKRKELALVIVLDKSYSMKGAKIELAKEAVKAALDLLEETHRFGVITFNWDPFVTLPLQSVSNKPRLVDEVSRIQASGQTNIFPALKSAHLQLAATDAKVRHAILLSDGKSYPNDYQTLVSRMAEEDITVSTVAVGEEADRELLANIGRWGKGRSYFVEDANRVPQIFIEETQLAVQTTLTEKPFQPTLRHRIEAFRGIDFTSAPKLRGYVATEAKEGAEVLLESDNESPILARWRYGLGKVAVFTSDVKNRWATDWLNWPGYGKLWSQLARETSRRDRAEETEFRVAREGNDAVVTLESIDAQGNYRNDLAPTLMMRSSLGAPSEMVLRQEAPGLYRGRLPLGPASESYTIELNSEELAADGWEETGSRRALFHPYPDELRFYEPRIELLEALAVETGGKMAPEIDDLVHDYGETVPVPTPLRPWLTGLALLIYLFDVALRRAPWFRKAAPSPTTG
jgi:uncharacterized membrane protein